MDSRKQEILLLNDSFPPVIDGVVNAVVNYADCIQKSESYDPCVVTPAYPGADDSGFPYPVIRYPSIDLREKCGYTAGIPFEPQMIRDLSRRKGVLIHSHCPVASNLLGRCLREQMDIPLILSYHSRFDVEIEKLIRGKALQQGVSKALIESVSAADELWVVSESAAQSLRKMGYEGEYVVMDNGVDMPRGRASAEEIARVCAGYDLPAGLPVFLFVGRLVWYKGLKLILDALAALKSQHLDFRMLFVGQGADEAAIRSYAKELDLGAECIFTGPVSERQELVAWYSRADLFLFPSSADTSGLVVREAAACSLGAVLIAGSGAAEGTTDGVNCLLVQEDAASLAVCLARVMDRPEYMGAIGENAARELYLSWDESVRRAMERYEIVMDKYKCGDYKRRRDFQDLAISLGSGFLELLEYFSGRSNAPGNRIVG